MCLLIVFIQYIWKSFKSSVLQLKKGDTQTILAIKYKPKI